MKRVVFFGVKTFPSRGGTDRVAENIILQLKDKFDITVYCFKDPAAQHHMPGVRVIEFKQWLPGAPGSFIYFFFSALHLFFKNQADVVHIHKTESTFFAPLLRLRYKIVSTSHEAQYKSDKWNWFARIFFHLVERIFIKSSDVCTCISQPLSAYYTRRYEKAVRFIPNGINPVKPETFSVEGVKAFLPVGASLERPFVLFAARRIMSIKGCHTMLAALAKVGYTGQVFITGELHTADEYLNKLRELAKGLNVHFLGFVNPLNVLLGLISRSELFIFPSETEGMSIMLLEVASVGRPIIASDIPENLQVFTCNEVLYFKSKDSQDLAEKIKYAFENPKAMEILGNNCQRKVYSDYLWLNIAGLYEQVYLELMASKAGKLK
jgi:glycosyltransferase involved in cell wall biosynthesis